MSAKPIQDLTGNEVLLYFTAGYVEATAKAWRAFLPTVKTFGPGATALYIAGVAACEENARHCGCVAMFRHQAAIAEATIEFMLTRNLRPYLGENGVMFGSVAERGESA